MLEHVIQAFLDERKKIWLNRKIKSDTTDAERVELEQVAAHDFSLNSWLISAAERAGRRYIVSHHGKFTHPGAKISPIIATRNSSIDGFIRTGNVDANPDVAGNAAVPIDDVYQFLYIKLKDEQTLLTHLEKETEYIKEQLNISEASFEEIQQGLLSIKRFNESIRTSEKVKQVYFPIRDDEYNLLSILTPPGIMFKLKERINIMHFSNEVKEVRNAKKNKIFHEKKYSEIYGLSVIGFGGTKPQNISVLNSQNHGTTYLLPSLPPELTTQKIRPPKTNFFTNSLWFRNFKDDFHKFHNHLIKDTNNIHIRKKRDWYIRGILYQVADQLWKIRSLKNGWSDSDNYKNLPRYQKIWLDQSYFQERKENSEWIKDVQKELSRWFINTYKKTIGNNALAFGDEHMKHIKAMISECKDAIL